MMYLTEKTSRADLELAYCMVTGADAAPASDTDAELLAFLQNWIAAGDECEAA